MCSKKQELISFLKSFVTEARINTINEVLNQRTRYLTVVLENIFQPHNASAVMRSCDCFGIQDVHIVENDNEYQVNRDVALGSTQWLTINKYNNLKNNTLQTIEKLKSAGYRIVATSPHTESSINEFDLHKGKTALMFGTEQSGLSDIAMSNADEYFKIPIHGFTESFNISVSVAITLHYLTNKLHSSNINFKLGKNEKIDLKLKWLINSIKKPHLLINEFCEKNNIDKELFSL